MAEGYITIGTELDTKQFDKQILELERKINDLEKIVNSPKDIGLTPSDIESAELELEKTKNKLIQIRKQQEKVKQGQQDINNEAKKNTLSKSFSDAMKKAGKLALAIFGIRSAYMLVKQASSDLASYDEQYATDLEYIRFALTEMIAPALRYIVQLAGTLLQYINAIAQAWFGVNLFANGSAEAFNKMKKSAGGIGKAVKEIKKQLTGFDEINMLTDQSDTGTSVGAGGVGMPSFDLGEGIEIPEWLQWIIDHKLELLELGGITALLGSIVTGWEKLREIFQNNLDWFKDQKENVRKYFGDLGANIYQGVLDYAQMILDVIDDIVNGLKETFNDVIEFFESVFAGDWEKAWQKILDIATNPIEALKNIFETVISLFRDTIGNFVDFLRGKSDWIRQTFGDTIGDLFDKFVDNWEIAKNIVDDLINAIKTHFDNVIQFVQNVFTGNWEGAWNNLGNIVTNKFEFIRKTIENILKAIGNVFTGWADAIGTTVGDTISGAFKNVVNGILGAVEYILNNPIRRINSLISLINTIPGANLSKISTFSLPRLAVGGIVNMPNRGTMVGGAIAGESGKEGVLPLTDRQAMEELGRTIGKYITVNANVVNTMNGRVISRELKQIQNEQDFVYNT